MAETYNVWLKKWNCLATIKICGVICPCPWAMYMYKIVKSVNVFFIHHYKGLQIPIKKTYAFFQTQGMS